MKIFTSPSPLGPRIDWWVPPIPPDYGLRLLAPPGCFSGIKEWVKDWKGGQNQASGAGRGAIGRISLTLSLLPLGRNRALSSKTELARLTR